MWIWNFRKKMLKIRNSKFPKILWWGPLGGKFRRNMNTFGCDLYEERSFEFLFPFGLMKMNFQIFKFQKSETWFWVPMRRHVRRTLKIIFGKNRKCTEWRQNKPECYKVKGTPYMLNYCPFVPNFTRYRFTIVRFPDNWGVYFLHRV